MRNVKLTLFLILTLAACSPAPNPEWEQQRNPDIMTAEDSDRVSITRVGIFRDRLAYDNERGIYVIYDKVTGREFIGISGIGISEVGAHTVSNGKVTTRREDER